MSEEINVILIPSIFNMRYFRPLRQRHDTLVCRNPVNQCPRHKSAACPKYPLFSELSAWIPTGRRWVRDHYIVHGSGANYLKWMMLLAYGERSRRGNYLAAKALHRHKGLRKIVIRNVIRKDMHLCSTWECQNNLQPNIFSMNQKLDIPAVGNMK